MSQEEPCAANSQFVINDSSIDQWFLWQLADSAFPIGGFAHSAGLEAAWQHREVRDRHELVSYIEASLHQLGHTGLPFVTAAHDGPDRLEEFDQLCDVFITNHVANRASRAQGKSFLAAVRRIFLEPVQVAPLTPDQTALERATLWPDRPQCAHFAPVFGMCLRVLNVTRETTNHLFFFNHLRSVLAAAVRLNIVGPMEAQILQCQLSPRAQQIIAKCDSFTLDDIAQTSPLLDLWQGAQDRLYSRLFQS